MGVESIELDTVNLRMVARTLARQAVRGGSSAPRSRGPCAAPGRHRGVRRQRPDGRRDPAFVGVARRRGSGDAGRAGAEAMTSWLKTKLGGRFRVSTLVLIAAFVALFWVQQSVQPAPAPEAPVPAVVPPGFVPDPNYTWVPRTQVRRPRSRVYTTTTTADDDDRDDDTGAGGHHDEPDVAEPDDDGGRSGRPRWPARAADARSRHPTVDGAARRPRPRRARCPPRPKRRDSSTEPALSHRYTGVP